MNTVEMTAMFIRSLHHDCLRDENVVVSNVNITVGRITTVISKVQD